MGNQTRSKEYLSINPLGQIPFLIDGNFKLAESSAILVYLCEKFPSQLGSYYGNTEKERALTNQFLSTYQSIYRPVVFKIIFLKIYKGLKRKKAIKAS
jgi:glutathione S-transferase